MPTCLRGAVFFETQCRNHASIYRVVLETNLVTCRKSPIYYPVSICRPRSSHLTEISTNIWRHKTTDSGPWCGIVCKITILAGIPWDRHGHRHRHGHPRRLTREDRREDVGVSGDFPVRVATSRTRTMILADLSADLSDTRTFPRKDPREDVR